MGAPYEAFSSDSGDTRIVLVICLMKDHVLKFPFVHELAAFQATVEVAVAAHPFSGFHLFHSPHFAIDNQARAQSGR